MSGPYPILPNGIATPHGIGEASTTQYEKIGTRGWLDDGRVYRYSRAVSATPLVAGDLIQRELTSVDWDDLATDHLESPVGSKIIQATPVGSKAYTKNELAEGYCVVNSGTGLGHIYQIESHLVGTAATELDLQLYHKIIVAFAAATTVTVIKNSWMDPIIAATAGASLCVGMATVAVPDGSTNAQYFWTQTWGMAPVAAGATTGAGDAVMVDTSTAGETLIATAGNQVIGVNIFAAVDGDTCPTFLQVAP